MITQVSQGELNENRNLTSRGPKGEKLDWCRFSERTQTLPGGGMLSPWPPAASSQEARSQDAGLVKPASSTTNSRVHYKVREIISIGTVMVAP